MVDITTGLVTAGVALGGLSTAFLLGTCVVLLLGFFKQRTHILTITHIISLTQHAEKILSKRKLGSLLIEQVRKKWESKRSEPALPSEKPKSDTKKEELDDTTVKSQQEEPLGLTKEEEKEEEEEEEEGGIYGKLNISDRFKDHLENFYPAQPDPKSSKKSSKKQRSSGKTPRISKKTPKESDKPSDAGDYDDLSLLRRMGDHLENFKSL